MDDEAVEDLDDLGLEMETVSIGGPSSWGVLAVAVMVAAVVLAVLWLAQV